MAKVVKRSPVPIYLVGVTWLVYAILLPLYRVGDYLICAAVSLLVWVIGKAIWPDAVLIVDEPEAKQEQPPQKAEKTEKAEKTGKTGNEQLDKLLAERDRAISEMRRLNEAIPDEKISAQIDHMEQATRQIIAQVVEKPEKLPQIRRFMNYYLPTTLKILNAYDRMGGTGISGENIDATKEKVEKMMDTLVQAFDKQLDSLFGAEALDISTDIQVLETMLAREGLAGQSITAEENETTGGIDHG